MSDMVNDARHEAGMMPDWRDKDTDPRVEVRLAVVWPNLLRALADEIERLRAEVSALRADLAMARERGGATGLEYREG
jgi:hypothetical protein